MWIYRMVGTIVKVGAKAEGDLKLGQVVGIGSQIGCEIALNPSDQLFPRVDA